MRKSLVAFLAFAALLFVGVAAAQGQSSSTPPAGSPAACASPMASPMSSPMATMTTAASSPAAGTATASNECGSPSVTMVDINFQPKELTIPANTDVMVALKNDGATVHNFNIDALNVHSGDYQPGQTGSVKINAKPGDYQYYCNIPGHKEAGMVGTLHVK